MQLGMNTLKEIKGLTANNCHGEAMLAAAKALGNEELAERFASINQRHMAMGHLQMKLYEERRDAYVTLIEEAKAKLSPGDFKQLYASL